MKKLISVSGILAILLSQTGCVGDKSQLEGSTETEKTVQEQENTPSPNKDVQMITFTQNTTGQEIRIPLEEFKKMNRLEFAKKMGVSEEEANKLSDADFERTKQAMIEWDQLIEEDTDIDDVIDKVQDFKQRFQDVADKKRMHIREEINISTEADIANDEK